MKRVIISLISVALLSLGLCSCSISGDIIGGIVADIINTEASISLEEFNEIETGMTYDEVCDIVGGEGTLGTSVDVGFGDAFKTEAYQWAGEGSIGAIVTITFRGGKVMSKAQVGLG